MKRFFSYDDQNEFELHDTLAEAKAAAEKAFEYCRDEARSDWGWPESVDEICYGELRGHVVETLREPWDVDKHGSAPEEGCEHVEYALHDLPHAEVEALRGALKEIRSLSSIHLVMGSDPFDLAAMLGEIHQIAGAALAKENSND